MEKEMGTLRETKCIVLGENKPKNEKMQITFEYFLSSAMALMHTDTSPDTYNYLELIVSHYGDDYDLIFAYNTPDRRDEGTLYLGKWNDGIV